MDPTAKVLKFIAESGMSDAQFTRETGISNGLIGQWRSGKQKASLKNLQKIADHFKLDVSMFLSNDEPDVAGEDPQRTRIIAKIKNLDTVTLLKLEKILDMILEEK